jgi:BCCT family betaine/carnitine transporter
MRNEVMPLSNPFGREDTGYMQGWTAFYWAWWISWSPFVGMFIARVSRGRTVREFVTCVLIIPSLVCILWMAVFGGAAINDMIANPGTAAREGQRDRQLQPELRSSRCSKACRSRPSPRPSGSCW